MNRMRVFALSLLLAPALASSAAAQGTPTHNFVEPDLTWNKPPLLGPNTFRTDVEMIDSASVTRVGDTVTFDKLILDKNPLGPLVAGTVPPRKGNVTALAARLGLGIADTATVTREQSRFNAKGKCY